MGLLFLTGALLLGIVCLEVATRGIYDRGGMHYGIEMWKYARSLKQVSSDPALGHEHRPGSQAHLMGVDVRINRRGLRDRNYSISKPPNTSRILVLGDSMTFGWGAPVESTYPEVVERSLEKRRTPRTGQAYEVINAGVGNYNTAQQVAYFRSRGVEYDPDVVLLAFYVNDAEPTPRPSSSWLARNSYLYVLARSGLDTFARQRGMRPGYESYYHDLYREDAPGWRTWRDALAELAALCASRGIVLVLVQVPELHQPDEGYPFAAIHELTAQAARAHELPVVDLLPAFAGIDPPSLWVSPGDAHPNARAHGVMAEAIFEQLDPLLDALEAAGSR